MRPYTYLIIDLDTNMRYYGVRYSDECDPSDLGVSYFSSSKVLKPLIMNDPERFVFEVRQVFNSRQSAIDWEHRLLTRIDAAKSPDWYNKHNGGKFYNKGHAHTIQTRQRISATTTGVPKSLEQRKAMSVAKLGKKGVLHTEETKARMSLSRKGKLLSEEQKLKLRKPKSIECTLARIGKKRGPYRKRANVVMSDK